MSRGEIFHPIGVRGEVGNFGEGRDFFIGWWKSAEEWFGPAKPISMLKQHSVNIEHQENQN